MKRMVIAMSVAVVLAAAVAGVSGAFSSGGSHAGSTGRATNSTTAQTAQGSTSTMAHMTMSSATGAHGSVDVLLHQAVVHVKISNFAFQPARIEVSPGTRIVWTNEDSDPHTVTEDSPGFSSQALDTGSTYALVVNRAGALPYHCTIHPFMHGTVIVKG